MQTKLKVRLEYITPEKAENYLKFNKKNRDPKDKHVTFLANQMSEGLFMENGESIVFDENHVLNDGQHRLLAIIKSGKSYHIPVVEGAQSKSMATYDTGSNRSASDVLQLNGFQSTSILASTIKIIHKFATRNSKAGQSHGTSRTDTLTNQQVLNYASENYDWLKPLINEVVKVYTKAQNPKPLNKSQMCLLAYMIGGETPSQEVYDFLKHLVGVIRTESTAPNYVYTKLYNAKINKDPLNFYWVLGMCLKAWNYYITGNPAMKYLKFDIANPLPKPE